MSSLQQRTALITGASSGIGAACARRFAASGARLILCARRLERLEQLREELQNSHQSEILCLELDVCDRPMVAEKLAALPDEWKTIDVLINNAGLAAGLETVAEANVDDWEQMIDTNIKGVLYLTRNILPGMRKRNSGYIVQIASTAGHVVYPGGSVYCATKHAVRALTKTLQLELMDTDIRVSSVDPGMVETEFSQVRFKGDDSKAQGVYQGVTPLQADDVADAVEYCVTRPPHVMVAEIVLLATAQGDGRSVHRQTKDEA